MVILYTYKNGVYINLNDISQEEKTKLDTIFMLT